MDTRIVKNGVSFLTAAILLAILAGGVLAGQAGVSREGSIVVYTQPKETNASKSGIDYLHARPMPMPTVDGPLAKPAPDEGIEIRSSGKPYFERGRRGSGETTLQKRIPLPESSLKSGGQVEETVVAPQEYGEGEMPFTTMRVDLEKNIPSVLYPYSAAGKLYFNIGDLTYVCSGSLIKKGIVVTAAHCVAQFGEELFYSNWRYVPAMSTQTMPYGEWEVRRAYVKGSYFKGTDPCTVEGVVCENDVALLVLKPQDGKYAGDYTGWLGFGVNTYGFNDKRQALVNQLGYPVSHDQGLKMQRTDAQGYVDLSDSRNTVWGSRQTGGSSGGPVLVNLGVRPRLESTDFQFEGKANMVIGVTSWGYTDHAIKVLGASPFTSDNIKALVTKACNRFPEACN